MTFTYPKTALTCCLLASSLSLWADNVIYPGSVTLDRPTVTSVSIRLPLTGDDNHNATAGVRYRKSGSSSWTESIPLFRVRPENVSPYAPAVGRQFSGSLVDLRPGTTYDYELLVNDPDGGSRTIGGTASTRAIPGYPSTARTVSVRSTSQLISAFNGARPGDIIELADGIYQGQFSITASGTLANPIVIRGASRDNTIIDGANCDPCNVIDVYGSYVQMERLTIRNAQRAIRWQGNNTTGNVLRRARITNTFMGVAGKDGQTDFYIADNIMEGRIPWPVTYATDYGAARQGDCFSLSGSGHVINHNQISGYSDAFNNYTSGWKDTDMYGNDILWAYGSVIAYDYGSGNIRFGRNRATNTYMPISMQPGYVGPFYAYRNVLVNSVDEQLKLHPDASQNPRPMNNGFFVYNNTFVSPNIALLQQGDNKTNTVSVLNNLFVGAPHFFAFNWYGPVSDATFDYNGYFPDGFFTLARTWNGENLAAFQATGREIHGKVLKGQIFESGLMPPASWTTRMAPQNATLSSGSNAIDAGVVIPGISSVYSGSAPDMGALERGCALPIYGVRPEGVDESNEDFTGCGGTSTPPPPPPPPVVDPPAAVAGSLTAVSGAGQSAQTAAAFSAPLVVLVKDTTGAPMSGVSVTFTAPGSGASAAFGSSPTATVVSDGNGRATSPALTANSTAGSYNVSGAVAGIPVVVFGMTNTAPAAPPPSSTTIAVQGFSTTYDVNGVFALLSAAVTSPSGTVNGGDLTFLVDGVRMGTGIVSNGRLSLSFIVPAARASAGAHTITAQYAGAGNVAAATGTAQLTVAKGNPTLNWPALASVPAGTALSAAQLNVTASVPGTFTYSPAIGTVVNYQTTLTANFTPTDTANYNTRSTSTALTVTPRAGQPPPGPPASTPTTSITLQPVWSTYDSNGVFAPFFATVTSSTETVNGRILAFYFDGVLMGSGHVTNGQLGLKYIVPAARATAGTHTITATLEGSGATGSAQFTVAKGNPILLWAPLAPVARGTALTAAHFSISSNVPGTFTYSPGPGTVVNYQTMLTANFTPTDTANYNSRSITTAISVRP